MAQISFASPQVNAAVTYNWSVLTPYIGDLNLCTTTTYAPGVGAGAGINTITTSIAPLPVNQPVLGQIVSAWEPVLGFGEFIYLQVPASTTMALGTMVTWFSGTAPNYSVVPILTTAKLAQPAAVCVSNTTSTPNTATGGGITSTTGIQYGWFQLTGLAQTLKTAVIHTLNSKVFISATAGRVMVTSASGTQLLGCRFATSNSATISCALVWYDRPTQIGYIT